MVQKLLFLPPAICPIQSSLLSYANHQVWCPSRCRLMYECKGLVTNTLKKYKKILERRRHHFHFLHLLSCSLFLLSDILIKVSVIYYIFLLCKLIKLFLWVIYVCHTWNSSKQNLWLTKLSFVSSINDITHDG